MPALNITRNFFVTTELTTPESRSTCPEVAIMLSLTPVKVTVVVCVFSSISLTNRPVVGFTALKLGDFG
jgi:hypothetical protein